MRLTIVDGRAAKSAQKVTRRHCRDVQKTTPRERSVQYAGVEVAYAKRIQTRHTKPEKAECACSDLMERRFYAIPIVTVSIECMLARGATLRCDSGSCVLLVLTDSHRVRLLPPPQLKRRKTYIAI